MKFAKTLCSSVLGTLVLLLAAPEASAQRVMASGYSYSSYSHAHGGYGHVSSRVWVPGRYETIQEQVWIPGCSERVWVDPVFEWRAGSCHTQIRVQLGGGYWRTVHHPGHYELRPVTVYRQGYWAARGTCR